MAERYFIPLVNRNTKFTLFIVILILFSVYFFVLSDSGILKRIVLKHAIQHIQDQIALKQQQIDKINRLDNNKMYSMYMLQESINAGYIPTGAKVYQFKDIPDSTKHREDSLYQTQYEKYLQYIQYGRIFWITFSALIMSGLLLHYRKKRMVL